MTLEVNALIFCIAMAVIYIVSICVRSYRRRAIMSGDAWTPDELSSDDDDIETKEKGQATTFEPDEDVVSGYLVDLAVNHTPPSAHRCVATTLDGTRCKHKTRDETRRCSTHQE